MRRELRTKTGGEKQTRPIPIRLTDSVCARLDLAAGRISSSRSCVIRLAILKILPEIESGHLRLLDEPSLTN